MGAKTDDFGNFTVLPYSVQILADISRANALLNFSYAAVRIKLWFY